MSVYVPPVDVDLVLVYRHPHPHARPQLCGHLLRYQLLCYVIREMWVMIRFVMSCDM